MLRDRKLVCEEERKIEAGQGQSGRKEGIGRARKREGQTEAEENKGRENVRGDEQEGGRSSRGGRQESSEQGEGEILTIVLGSHRRAAQPNAQAHGRSGLTGCHKGVALPGVGAALSKWRALMRVLRGRGPAQQR